jgi:glycosyltransferase involved in cell wall biosynthesis
VDRAVFHPKPLAPEKSYFLAVGRLMHYKRFDLIVRAFNELQLPLRIAGIGPELDRLRALNTSPYTRFLGFVPRDEELCDLYNGARALIFPQVEDFGLVAAEAIACGTPVIAYAEGGATEIVNERTGIFFDKQTEPALINAVRLFSKCYFSPAIVADTAARFSKERFLERIRAVIAKELPRFQEA